MLVCSSLVKTTRQQVVFWVWLELVTQMNQDKSTKQAVNEATMVRGVGLVAAAALVWGAAVARSSYFVHFSDPHVDFGYAPGSPTTCALQKLGWPCCHAWSTNTTPCELAPRFGHRNCDPPRETVQQIVEQAARLYPEPLLVLLTGDLASHDAFNEVPASIADKWDWLFTLVRRCFGADQLRQKTTGFPPDYIKEQRQPELSVSLLVFCFRKSAYKNPDFRHTKAVAYHLPRPVRGKRRNFP